MATRLMCWMFVVALLLAGTASAQLVIHYSFDNVEGDTVDDLSGSGNVGTLEDGPTVVEGQLGQALAFESSRVSIPASDSLSADFFQGSFTVVFWINPKRTGNTWQQVFRAITSGATNDTMFLNNDGRLSWRGTVNGAWAGGMCETAPGVVPADQWTHAAVTGDGTNFRIYVNGALSQESAFQTTNGANTTYFIGGTAGGESYSGAVDDFAVFAEALEESDIQSVMSGLNPKELAAKPNPENESMDINRDTSLAWAPGAFAQTHNVYLGTVFDDVNTADPALLVGDGLGAPSLDVGRLDFSQTYFWRVDEVNSAPDFTVFGGNVWSFTVEPFSIPISGITATASSSFGASGPEKTIDGSGLVDGLHGVSANDMWISGGIPATIDYAFDRAYKLHELQIWNSNQLIEAFVGFGAKDVVIEHSLDGENWTVLDGVGPLAQAPGGDGYAHNNAIDFGGATAQHVRVTVNSVHGIAPQASLSEVRFLFIPTFASRPSPDSGATNVAPDTSLYWGRDGREAASHDVYLGTDAGNLDLAGSISESSFDTSAVDLQLGQSYAWRVDEVNDVMDPSTWEGMVWSFTTADSISIDDMESYADAEFFEIWATWVDGFDDPANGSLVGIGAAGTPETGIVQSGSQSLPMDYGIGGAALSEATRTFDAPMDWTGHGVQTLVLYFQGGPNNTGGALYVKINNTKILYDGDAGDLGTGTWQQWNIDLSTVGGNLMSVTSLTIGVEGAGATGVVYIDSIGLYALAP